MSEHTPGAFYTCSTCGENCCEQDVARDLLEALKNIIKGWEVDCESRDIDPASISDNHTWAAIWYREAVAAIAKAESSQ